MPHVTRLDGSVVPAGTVYCIARNSFAHAAELGNAAPTEPIVFLKSAASLRPLDAPHQVAFPDETYHHEAELVLLLGRDVPLGGDPGWSAVEAVALGLDLTRRGVQNALKADGLPWARAKSFHGAAPVGPFVPLDQVGDPDALAFSLTVRGERRQQGRLDEMAFPVPVLLRWLAQATPLLAGDLVFTGTPPGVGDIRAGDGFELALSPSLRWHGTL